MLQSMKVEQIMNRSCCNMKSRRKEVRSMENLTENMTTALALIKSVMSLFGEFPLNLILVFSLGGVAFKLFKRARRAAG